MEFRSLLLFLLLPCVMAAEMTDIEVFLLVSTCVLGGLLALSAGALVYCYCIPKETAAPAVVIQQAPPPKAPLPKAPPSTNQIQPINAGGSGTAGTGVAARPLLGAGANVAALQTAQRAKANASTEPQTAPPASVTNVAMNAAAPTAGGDFV